MTDSTSLEEIDPRNVLAMVSNSIREAAIRTYQEFPHYQDMSEAELEREVNPSKNANYLRGSFWREYRRAKDSGKARMMMSHIYDGVMTKDGFLQFIESPKQVAWMLKPPVDEYLQMEVDNYRLRQKYSELLNTPIKNADGEVNIKLARLTLDIYKMYADRLHGSIVQRVEKKIQNIPADNIGGSADEIRQKIKELEAIQVDVKVDNGDKANNEGE